MSVEQLSNKHLNNAYFNLLTAEEQKLVANFNKVIMDEKSSGSKKLKRIKIELSEDEELEWILKQIMSGLQVSDLTLKSKMLLEKTYGKQWKKLLF